jgi:hypothetical protein
MASSTGTSQNTNSTTTNAGFNFANSANQIIDFNAKIDHVLDSDETLEDNNDFIDLLGLEDWEQMLDEDCISRLTADFNNNIINMSSTTPSKPLVSTPINPTNSSIIQPTPVVNKQEIVTTTSTVMPKIQYITNTKSQPISNNNKSQPLVLLMPQSNTNQSFTSNSNTTTTSIKKLNLQGGENTNSSLSIITNTKPNLPTTIISNTTAHVVRRLSSVMLNENKNNNGQNHGTTTKIVTAAKSTQSLTSILSNKNTNVRIKIKKSWFKKM